MIALLYGGPLDGREMAVRGGHTIVTNELKATIPENWHGAWSYADDEPPEWCDDSQCRDMAHFLYQHHYRLAVDLGDVARYDYAGEHHE